MTIGPVRPRITALALAALLAPLPAAADLEVRFDEGAPKDRFTLRNAGACALSDAEISIDLRGSAGGLVFDVSAGGHGVEVFQPLELVEGAAALSAAPTVRDGDRSVTLAVARLDPGAAIAFTIDVDDTVATRAITVTDGELSGATVRVAGPDDAAATFDGRDRAMVRLTGCRS